jgi:hypothetical protein
MLSTWFRSKSIVRFVLNKSFKVLTLCHNGLFAIRIQPKTGNLNFRFERQMDTTPDEGGLYGELELNADVYDRS